MRKEKSAVDTDDQADKTWLLDIQHKLYAWSRAHPDDAWREMWNWLTDPRNLRLAWRRVASNRGARSAGVDKLTVHGIEQRLGVERFLTGLRVRLRKGSYRPSPVRRVMIPKRGKPGSFRPLGVPTVCDRVVQAAVLHLLEPIFEADFFSVSYGFRPKRACRDALEHIRMAIRPGMVRGKPAGLPPPYQWVIEGDIKSCFDEIDHHSVMVRLRRRIGDVKVCRLVRAFLKSGVLAEEVLTRTEVGTPQGGILSPLLSNVVLSAIEERYRRFVSAQRGGRISTPTQAVDAARNLRKKERKAGRPVFLPVRYADDFVVLVSGTQDCARAEKEELARYLRRELKLTLSEEKTHVTALTEGFRFLGHRVRLRWDPRFGYWPRLEIPKEQIKDLCYRIKQMTQRGQTHRPLRAVIDALNPVLLGWGCFYQHCYNAKAIFTSVDHYVWGRIWRWLVKKHPTTPHREIVRRYSRRTDGRDRLRWCDQRPVAIVADLKVGRHNLGRLRYPDYTTGAGEPGA
jgi:RNA-directed DNA polymerase